MPKEYFQIENTTSVRVLPAGARVHIIGVCGVAMAHIAIQLVEQGFEVSGSDREFYEPMGGLLRESSVKCHKGYDASNIPSGVDLVIIGNVVPYTNPEALEVEQKGYPYSLFPKVLYELLIDGRHSIVVSGTHGKTTTTAMAACVLKGLERDPSYFIGGKVESLGAALRCGAGDHSVVEGDEYDSAFFAKTPKFHFYKPHTLIVTSLEFDHADIYESIDQISAEFEKLLGGLSEGSRVIACVDFPRIQDLIDSSKLDSAVEVITYGQSQEAQYRVALLQPTGLSQVVTVHGPQGEFEFTLALPGMHNACNALAVWIATSALGLDQDSASAELAKFTGVRRRQDVRFDENGITVIEDFAHHPSAVRETLAALRAAYPERTLIAAFEPRSNTSRRKVFQSEYAQSFDSADEVYVREPLGREVDLGFEMLDASSLISEIAQRDKIARSFSDTDEMRNYLLQRAQPDSVLVIMTNGSFDGLIDKLLDQLKQAE